MIASQAQAESGRALGYMETRMHLMHTLLRGSTQGVVALRVRGHLDPQRFVAAVEQVARAHELLRARIVERDGSFAFECRRDAEANVRVLLRSSDDEWLRVVQGEVESPLDPSRALYRLTLLADAPSSNDADIVLSVHHAIMDGSAVDNFLDQVLTAATNLGPVELAHHALPPPAEQMLPKRMRLSWADFCETQRSLGERLAVPRPPYLAQAPIEERRTKTAFVALEATQVAALERYAEARNCTFNALASVALVCAVQTASPQRKRVLLNSTFSLRRLCSGLGSDDLGCYMSIVPTLHDSSAGARDLGELAAEYHAALSAAILQNVRCPLEAPAEALRKSTLALLAAREFVQDVGLTFGESSLRESYGPLSLVHMYAAVNRSAGTLAAVVHGVKIAGKACFTLNYTAPLQSDAWANQVTARFASLFAQLATSERN